MLISLAAKLYSSQLKLLISEKREIPNLFYCIEHLLANVEASVTAVSGGAGVFAGGSQHSLSVPMAGIWVSTHPPAPFALGRGLTLLDLGEYSLRTISARLFCYNQTGHSRLWEWPVW